MRGHVRFGGMTRLCLAATVAGLAAAAAHDVRVCEITSDEITQGNAIDRYVSLMQQGLYGAAYLGIGLGRSPQ